MMINSKLTLAVFSLSILAIFALLYCKISFAASAGAQDVPMVCDVKVFHDCMEDCEKVWDLCNSKYINITNIQCLFDVESFQTCEDICAKDCLRPAVQSVD